jgi:alpha-L-fucosidase
MAIFLGERVRQYVIEGFSDGQWVKLAEGTAIGHKKIDRFDRCQVSRIRLRCLKSAAEPQIHKLAVYLADSPTTAAAGK